jgi:hypothetical protein
VGQILGELGHGEHRGLILADDLLQEFPDPALWPGGIDVAAPDPVFGLGTEKINQIGGLRVMDQDKI